MNIAVISRDSRYKELFQQDEEIKLALIFDSIKKDKEEKDANVPLHALLLDGKVFSHTELPSVRDKYPNIPVFYKFDDVKSNIVTKNIERVCAAYRVTPINEYFTVDQVVNTVLKVILNKDEIASKRIVSFFGTHSSTGVSTMALNVGRSLSERVEEKVLVVSLNAWDPSDYFLPYEGQYLNDLKVDLKTKSLTTAKLAESVYQFKNFYHLAGNRDIKLQRFYKNTEIEHLIQVAKEMFDIILIDGGVHFDTACASQAYVSSNLRFIVTNQDDKGYRGYFPHVFQQLIEPSGGSKDDFMLIINKFQPNMSLISEKDLEEELEMQKIATIPHQDVLGSVAIRQKKLLYDVADDHFRKSIDTISNLIISEAHLHEKPLVDDLHDTNKGLFGGFFGKKKQKEGEKVW